MASREPQRTMIPSAKYGLSCRSWSFGWLHANRIEGCTVNAINFAAALGDLRIVKWLHENLPERLRAKAMDFAAKFGHLQILKYLHSENYQRIENTLQKTIENGQVDIVAWLLEIDPNGSIGQTAICEAAARGHLVLLKQLSLSRLLLDWDLNLQTRLAVARQFGSLEWVRRSSLLKEDVTTHSRWSIRKLQLSKDCP